MAVAHTDCVQYVGVRLPRAHDNSSTPPRQSGGAGIAARFVGLRFAALRYEMCVWGPIGPDAHRLRAGQTVPPWITHMPSGCSAVRKALCFGDQANEGRHPLWDLQQTSGTVV